MKTCNSCQEEKVYEDFDPDRRTRDNCRSICKKCNRAAVRRWRSTRVLTPEQQQKSRESKAQDYKKHKTKRRATSAAWRNKNRERTNKSERLRAKRIKTEVINAYGGRCACCYNDFLTHLTIDHIEGRNGDKATGQKIYCRLKREGFPSGYQVLCWNCNSAKHIEGRCMCKDRTGVGEGGGG